MRPFLTALLFIFEILTVHGTKVRNSTPVDSAKIGGQTLCNNYAGEDPKTHEAIKKLHEKLELMLKVHVTIKATHLLSVQVKRMRY